MTRILCIRSTVLLAAALIAAASTGHAATITVQPGIDQIQGAVANASPGDVVMLANGTHSISSSVLINASISLVGTSQAGTIISKTNAADSDVAGIVSNVDNVTLRGFTIRGNGTGGPCILLYGNGQRLSNLTAYGCGNDQVRSSGILLHTANLSSLSSVTSNSHRMVGVSQFESSDNTLDRVIANGNGAEGLTIDVFSHNVHVSNSTFIGNNIADGGVGGVGIDASNGAWINNSTISGTQFRSGITLQNNVGGEDGLILTGNKIQNNGGHGILVRNCTYPVTNSTFAPNTYGGNALSPDFRAECPL